MLGFVLRFFCAVFQLAVEKYEEVLHNLAFAQELHKTLDSLTQSVSLLLGLLFTQVIFFIFFYFFECELSFNIPQRLNIILKFLHVSRCTLTSNVDELVKIIKIQKFIWTLFKAENGNISWLIKNLVQ